MLERSGFSDGLAARAVREERESMKLWEPGSLQARAKAVALIMEMLGFRSDAEVGGSVGIGVGAVGGFGTRVGGFGGDS